MIGLFNDCFPPIMDGVSLTVANYAHWLHMMGREVEVFTPSTAGEKVTTPYPVHRYLSVPLPRRRPYRIGLPRLDIRLSLNLRRKKLDLVHAHCPFSSGQLARRIAQYRRLPLVATFHSKFRDDFRRMIPSDFVVDRMLKSVVRFFESADEVWVPQASTGETLREYGYRGNFEVVDNGNEYADGSPLESRRSDARIRLKINPQERIMLFVGQHIYEKNLLLILDALSRLRDLPFRMYFVGTGYAQEALKVRVSELGLERKVCFVGCLTDRAVLADYYAAADLFLFPSIYDNAPLVIREAAALGCPSLLVAGSGSAEIVRDGVNGFLAPNDARNYADCIRRLYNDIDIVKTVGLEASNSLSRTWRDITSEVSDRYDSLVRRWRGERCSYSLI